MLHKYIWFKNHIGKRIFRDADSCTCPHCANVVENGLVIYNEQHADYIYTTQNDYYYESGIELRYRDKK